MNAEEYWPPNSCDCKTYSKSPQKTKKVWDRVKKLCRAKNRRDLEINRLKLRAQQKIKAGKKPEALVILREMKRLKDMKLTDYIAEKESAKLARAGANSGGRRRRRRRRRTRRGRGKGTDKFGRQLGTRRKRDADIRARRHAHPVQPLVHRRVAQLRTGFSWAAPSAEARKFKADMQGLGLGLAGLTFSRGQNSPKSSPKSSKRMSIKKKGGGRRRTRRRRGGQPPPKVTVGKIEADVEAEWKRRQNLMIARAAAEKSANDIQQILKKAAQEEVEAAAKRQS